MGRAQFSSCDSKHRIMVVDLNISREKCDIIGKDKYQQYSSPRWQVIGVTFAIYFHLTPFIFLTTQLEPSDSRHYQYRHR